MTELKGRIDPVTFALLKKAATAQVDLGLNEIVIDPERVAARQAELAAQGVAQRGYDCLAEHEADINQCQKCPLGKTRTKFVYGAGSDNAGIMLIGEAPGRNEDLQGIPFVGRAGILLDKILAAIGFERDDVYIANILKCRPPNNRDPQPEEMDTCLPYLLEQIRLIQPKVICALGRVAAQALLQTKTPLGKLRKQWHDFHGVPFLVTYHPAALLRNPAYKRDTWDDVQLLRARYDELMSG